VDPAISQEIEHLLLGGGFNFYRVENQLRADDLLVRQRAGNSLGLAAAQLDKLSQEFQRTCIAAPTRDCPYPPAEVMERLNALRRLRQRIITANSLLQALSSPAQDKIWRRFRDEQTLLTSLLNADIAMLRQAAELGQLAESLTAHDWKSADAGAVIDSACDRWDQTIRSRQELLEIGARA
jgi:hypothetical protein